MISSFGDGGKFLWASTTQKKTMNVVFLKSKIKNLLLFFKIFYNMFYCFQWKCSNEINKETANLKTHKEKKRLSSDQNLIIWYI
jgi:hypothetical protein